ncbi:MAG: hypothetical protein HXX11_14925, partial [Desulfuromonadales bacterium]|nr:hypothetical protein [Desulfuromonadales bacterium]
MQKVIVLLSCLIMATIAHAEPDYLDEAKIPAEIRQFILPGTRMLAFETADLNGDNLNDYLI